MDRRLTPANDRAALAHLRGVVDAPQYVAGTAARILWPLADLLARPDGPRDRQLVLGDGVTVIDRHAGWAFVQAAKDGYCGYLPEAALGPDFTPTHWLAAPASHAYPEPRVQSPARHPLYLGSQVRVTGLQGAWAETPAGFIPAPHLRAQGDLCQDPVCVAQSLLNAPYLWGGNSAAGIDCSGLVQGALLACGITCPGDSDQQQALGHALPDDAALRRGDLVFWRGHVALVSGPDQIIHANGYSMSVAYEPLSAAIARIENSNGGPVTARRRL